MANKITLTEVEFELMEILWDIKEGSVHDVLAKLPSDRQLAYTSVSTILRILEQKKIVETRKENRKHIYIPLISKENYQQSAVEKLVSNVFSGKPSLLINQLMDSEHLNQDEINQIKKMLNEKLTN